MVTRDNMCVVLKTTYGPPAAEPNVDRSCSESSSTVYSAVKNLFQETPYRWLFRPNLNNFLLQTRIKLSEEKKKKKCRSAQYLVSRQRKYD